LFIKVTLTAELKTSKKLAVRLSLSVREWSDIFQLMNALENINWNILPQKLEDDVKIKGM
jgi:hypothetical protein